MSTGSSPNPKSHSALVVVEGPTEREFFSRLGEKLGLNLTIHAVCCNVYSLYRWMTEECDATDGLLSRDDLTLDIPKLIAEHTDDASDRQILRQHYDSFYLIYDCDLHDTAYLVQGADHQNVTIPSKDDLPPIGDRARANMVELQQMVELLNDESSVTVGRLYLNYPMVESLWDADSFYDPLYADRKVDLSKLAIKDAYKKDVAKRLLFRAKDEMDAWSREDCCDLMRMNLEKSCRLLKVETDESGSDIFERCQAQDAILRAQCALAKGNAPLMVLNTSVFIPLDYHSLMADVRNANRNLPEIALWRNGENAEVGYVVFLGDGRQMSALLKAELQGLIRVLRNVDVVFFDNDFCKELPDYRQAIQCYDMAKSWAQDAVAKKLGKSAAWNWCCRAELVKKHGGLMQDLIASSRNKIVILHTRN